MVTGKKEFKLKFNPATFVGSQYAHTGFVNVTDDDVTIDFVYLHPTSLQDNATEKEVQVVSRVIMPVSQAEQVAKIVLETIKRHAEKNKATK